jgi:hypothetical protein
MIENVRVSSAGTRRLAGSVPRVARFNNVGGQGLPVSINRDAPVPQCRGFFRVNK